MEDLGNQSTEPSPEALDTAQHQRQAASVTSAGAPRRPLRILLAEGSSTSARQALYSLQRDDVVDVLDPNPLCLCRFSRWVRRWHKAPHYAEDPLGYLRFLNDRLRSEPYDVLLPTQEQVYLLSRVREELSRRTAVALPDFEALDLMQDKANFVRLLEMLELPHPPTTIVNTRAELEAACEFPCYVKLAHSTAGLGVHEVRSAAELQKIADEIEAAGFLDGQAEVIVQQPARGNLAISLSTFDQGRMVAHHNASVRAFGVGTAARESVEHAGVREEVEQIGRRLNWHGALFIEYFQDEATGQRQYLEANPRMGETLNARLCGVNLVEQLIRVSLDERPAMLAAGKIGVRSHQGFMLAIAAALEGKSRGEIFRTVSQARRQHGFFEHSEDELVRPREDWWSTLPATGVLAQLALSPSRARGIVAQTVRNYSLPGPAARIIRELPQKELSACFKVKPR